jgi:hypothetical protein
VAGIRAGRVEHLWSKAGRKRRQSDANQSTAKTAQTSKPRDRPTTLFVTPNDGGVPAQRTYLWTQREPGDRSSMRTSMDSNVQQLHYNLSDLRSGRECLPFAG